jgi:ribosomal protein S18 acetylase RimI-like enzyme
MIAPDPSPAILPLTPDDRPWVQKFVRERWHAPFVVSHGRAYHPEEFPGFQARLEGTCAGLVTYEIRERSCEIVTLDSLVEDRGVGTALIRAVVAAARAAVCRRLWLITTNDNLRALGFYQKRGFGLVALHRNALDRSRQLKPQIGFIGEHGIPLRDELELEYLWPEEGRP